MDRNTHPHKAPGYVSAVISLKPVGGIPGDATVEQMHLMAELSKRYSFDESRVTHTQNIVLPHVKIADLNTLWAELKNAGLHSPNLDTIEDIIACPGLDYCSLANARSIPIAQQISERFARQGRTQELGQLKLKISGCINACGHHHAGHIGILGVDKKGVENYQLLLGGSEAEDTALAKITGRGFDEEGIVKAVEIVTDLYLERRKDGERFLDTYRRLGMEPFKEVYMTDDLGKSPDDVQFRFRTDEVSDHAQVTVDSFLTQEEAVAVRLEPGDDARKLLKSLDRIR